MVRRIYLIDCASLYISVSLTVDSTPQVSNCFTSPWQIMCSSRDTYYVWDCSKKTPQHSQWNQPYQPPQKSGFGYFPAQYYWNSPKSDSWGNKTFSSSSSSSTSSAGSTTRSLNLGLHVPSQQIGGGNTLCTLIYGT